MIRGRRGLTVVEGLVGAAILAEMLLVLWPLVRTTAKSEAQLGALTGGALATSVLRERLRWDLELASPPELSKRAAALGEDGALSLSCGGAVAWRFDAGRGRLCRNGEPLGPPLASARFAAAGPNALELALERPDGKKERLVLRLPPALQGLSGWSVHPSHVVAAR